MTRRLIPRAAVAAVAAFALTATGCGTLRSVPLPGLVSGPTYEIEGVFDNVLGLPHQAAVKMDGATIGEVASIETVDYTARVRMSISEAFTVPADVRAEVRFGSPMGEAFIELADPEGGDGTTLSPGSVIPLEATSEAPSVGDLLSAASTLITGGSFADMKVIISELNTALRGNGGNIRNLIGKLDGMVTRLNRHTAEFDIALNSMERLGRRLAADRTLLAESLLSLEPAIKSLSSQRRQIFTLMSELRRLSKVGTATIASTRADMLSVLADLDPVLSTLTARQAEFRQTLDGIHDFAQATDSATLGLFLNFDLTTLFDGDVLSGVLPPTARQAAPRAAADEQEDAR